MTHKFDKHKGGKYWQDYVNKCRQFYDLMGEHINITPDDATILDIGAGPGVGAFLLDILNKRATIYGFEPSKMHYDGVILSDKLKAKKSPVHYLPINQGIESSNMLDIKPESVDGIYFLRCLHELGQSLGGKKQLQDQIKRTLSYLNHGGIVIVSEPQYNLEISENPSKYKDLLKCTRDYLQEILGHSHPVEEKIRQEECFSMMEDNGLYLVKHNLIEAKDQLEHVRNNGFNVLKSPAELYVSTFKKK